MNTLLPDKYSIYFRGIIKESLTIGISCEYNDNEDEYLLKNGTAGRHYHPYYELTLICSGEVLCDVNNTISLHTSGYIHLVRPQDNHALIRTGPLKYICIKFYRDMISQEIIDMLENREALLIADVREQMESFYADAMELCQLFHDGQTPLIQLELRLKLQVFLIRFVKALMESCSVHDRLNRRTSCIHKTLAYIHDHYTENITLNSAAEYAEISPNYLSSVFSSEMQMTFWNYITKCRLDKARMMLINTDCLIYDISFRCGFHTYDGFIKAFKKQYGISPTAYRNRLKNEKHFDFERKSYDFT